MSGCWIVDGLSEGRMTWVDGEWTAGQTDDAWLGGPVE